MKSSNFENWIASSVVRNSAGAPLRVFHGTYHPAPHFARLTHFGTADAAITRLFQTAYTCNNSTMIGGKVFSGFLNIQKPFKSDDCWGNSPIGSGGSDLFPHHMTEFTQADIAYVIQPLPQLWERPVTNKNSGFISRLWQSVSSKKTSPMSNAGVIKALKPYQQKYGYTVEAPNESESWKFISLRNELATERFAELLTERRYDGVIYGNTEEGGQSYIILDSNQLWLDDTYLTYREHKKNGEYHGARWESETIKENRNPPNNMPYVKDKAFRCI